jgi:hypothetical protein
MAAGLLLGPGCASRSNDAEARGSRLCERYTSPVPSAAHYEPPRQVGPVGMAAALAVTALIGGICLAAR